MTSSPTLVSHALCPCVQRIAIALAEKQVAHHRLRDFLCGRGSALSRVPHVVTGPPGRKSRSRASV